MYFFLTLKKVVHVLNDDMPTVPAASSSSGPSVQTVTIDNGDKTADAVKDKDQIDHAAQVKASELQLKKEQQLWIHNDYLCKGYIINGLCDDLYDYYSSYKTAKEVWDALKKKYDTEEASVKKYDVSRYLKYQMVDERSVEAQSHEIQKIAHEIITEGMPLDDQFQIAVIIDKLPPGWKDFKNQLRHKTKEFSNESLITRLRIEEESRRQDQKEEEKAYVVSGNKKKFGAVLKHTGKPLQNQNRGQTNRIKNGNPSRAHNAKQNPPSQRNDSGTRLNCFNCGKPGHFAKKM
jgi:cation transport regulator ChaB